MSEVPSSSTDSALTLMNVDCYYQRNNSTKMSSRFADACNYVGLVNQAMTCYLNSLLQALFMTPEFRNALYKWEFDGGSQEKCIPFQLQKLFLNLQVICFHSNRLYVYYVSLCIDFTKIGCRND